MKLLLKRLNNAFIPIDDEGVEIFGKIKEGEEILVEYKRHRNVGNHKRLFSMLQLIKQNQTKYKSVDNILTECKFKAGYFDIHISQNGEKILVPKSVNFASMGEDKFQEFFSSCIDTCLTLVPMGRDELEEAVLRYC